MKKAISWLTVCFLLMALLAGCQKKFETGGISNKPHNEGGINKESSGGKDTGEKGEENKKKNMVDFVAIDDCETLPAILRQAIEVLKEDRGYIWFENINGKTAVIVFAGEKNSGGYGIEVEYVTSYEDSIKAIVKETSPGKDDFVAMALTYPYVVILTDTAAEYLFVEDENGNKFKNLTMPELQFGTGVYVGMIDGNSIEIKIDKGFSYEGSGTEFAFRLDELSREFFDSGSSSFKSLGDNTRVEFSFYVNKHGQYVINDINQKT